MAKQKPVTKSRAIGSAHRELHKRRLAWFGVLAAGLLIIQLAYNFHGLGKPQVLGYATQMSADVLLRDTNTYREGVNLPTLKLNNELSRAAQAKADDMIKQNYWDHIAPDGTTPWQFLQKTSYGYSGAGENLAYGFATADQVVSAWMNSPEHRDNVLGNYQDIGFGIANGTYQGGENTLIVAFYGLPADQKPVIGTTTPALTVAAHMPSVAHQIHGATSIIGGNAPWATYASLALIGATIMGFLVTHMETLRIGWHNARRYAAVHPAIDAAVLLGAALIIVQAAGGFIR